MTFAASRGEWRVAARNVAMAAREVESARTAADALDWIQALQDDVRELKREVEAAWADEEDVEESVSE
jgi:hypothetical protein